MPGEALIGGVVAAGGCPSTGGGIGEVGTVGTVGGACGTIINFITASGFPGPPVGAIMGPGGDNGGGWQPLQQQQQLRGL